MARYKETDAGSGQGLFMGVDLKEQLIPGTFEHMLDELIGERIGVSGFDKNYNNDETGAKAVPPKVLIKLIIYGYSKGVKSSRGLDDLAKNNMIAKALSENMEPHWTTIAGFISGNGEGFKGIFVKVLAYCTELGLIGGRVFAVDGCRLPSNASLELTGTAEQLEKKLKVYRRMAEKHIEKHQRRDSLGEADERTVERYAKRQKHLNRQIEKISNFLENIEKKEGRRVKETMSNVTDNESATIVDSNKYIQGYIGLAVSDKENQVIVSAEAVGSANEGEHFPRILEKTLSGLDGAGVKKNKKTKRVMLADKNYFSEENLKACRERGVEAVMADRRYKQRLGNKENKRYETDDFKYYKNGNYYKCPNGKKLAYKGTTSPEGHEGKTYKASVKDCRVCPLNTKCLKTKKELSKIDKGRSLLITESNSVGSLSTKIRKKMDTQEYQDLYANRIQVIEPVFSNITYCKRLDRFTLRGKNKVNGQWQLYCIMHNLGKCLKGYNKKRGYA
jgi:transposase